MTPSTLVVKNEEPESLDFLDVDKDTYPRTYNFLKAQNEKLISLSACIKNNGANANPQDSRYYEYLAFLTQSLINCDFGTVFLAATNNIPAVQSIVSDPNVPKEIKQIASSILTVSINLSRIFSYVSCTLPTTVVRHNDDSYTPYQPQASDKKDDQNLVLCRICEEYVPVDMFEQHSKSCVIAYESEFTMITTNEEIKKLQKAITNSVLHTEWPGEANKTISTILPMLHVTMLLDIVSKDEKDMAKKVYDALNKIEIPDAIANARSLFDKAKELVTEKLKASSAFNEASAVLQKTRVGCHAFGTQSLQTSIADFTFIKRISSGAFAKVFLAVKVRSGDVYAIKVTPKSSLKQKNTLKRVLIEKDILLQNSNPFIVDFYFSIIGEHNLYLVMEYLPGGDLFSLLQNVGSLDEDSTKTYTAQIIKALEYLHKSGIIHRDLKPDNILVDINGKLKLTDFGLSLYGSYDRTITDDNKSIVGTPDYLAPEVILSQPHSFTADYWSLGVVVYEFLVGTPPFHRETESATFAQILSGKFDDSYLDKFSPEVKDFIHKLLDVDQKKRLGANGINEIMSHPWLKDLDWDHIDDLEPVFVPEQKDKYDVDYFTERYTFHKSDGIEKDILDDIEIAKTAPPHSVSMTDLSSKSSFASKTEEDTDDDDDDDMSMFPSIALKNLSRRASTNMVSPSHKRSYSISKEIDLLGTDIPPPQHVELSQSKSFVGNKAVPRHESI